MTDPEPSAAPETAPCNCRICRGMARLAEAVEAADHDRDARHCGQVTDGT